MALDYRTSTVSSVRKAYSHYPKIGSVIALDPKLDQQQLTHTVRCPTHDHIYFTTASPLRLSFSPTTQPTIPSTTTIVHTLPRASSPILPATPRMGNHRTEQRQPSCEWLPSKATAPVPTFHPARAPTAGNQTAWGTVSHPARASSADNLPVRRTPSAERGPLPRSPKSAPGPKFVETTVLRRSPDCVVVAGHAAVGENIRPCAAISLRGHTPGDGESVARLFPHWGACRPEYVTRATGTRSPPPKRYAAVTAARERLSRLCWGYWWRRAQHTDKSRPGDANQRGWGMTWDVSGE